MPNSFFSFKQFTIHQDQCAMKVCTDACLFGAWSATKLSERIPSAKKILDIGAGTGVLSLMMAQGSQAYIEAIEINPMACKQANENFLASPWKSRLTVMEKSISDYKKNETYDFIISNPPFYEADLRSPDEARTAAMHDSELTFEVLIHAVVTNLSLNGFATVLLPFCRIPYFKSIANDNNLFIHEMVNVRQTPAHKPFRSMILLSATPALAEDAGDICIHDDNRQYTPAFIKLLTPYYLNL